MLVQMTYTATTYTYSLAGHLDPKDWSVSVEDGKLLVQADVSVQLRGGETRVDHFEYSTKLSRQIAPHASFEVQPGEYFPGVEVTAPGVYGKQHAGGTLKIVFPRLPQAAPSA